MTAIPQPLVRARITITETTTYTRVVEMPRSEFNRLQGQLTTGDQGDQAEVAEAMFSFYVDRVDDQAIDQTWLTEARLTELPPLSEATPCADATTERAA